MLLADHDERVGYGARSHCAFAETMRKEYEAFMMIPARPVDELNSTLLHYWTEEETHGRFPLFAHSR